MANRISSLGLNGFGLFTDSGALLRLQELGAMVASAIAEFSLIEQQLSNILAALLKVSPIQGTAMYLAAAHSNVQMSVLIAAAENSLDQHEQDLFQAVRKIIKPQETVRNEFAHRAWATSDHPKLRNMLILVDTKKAAMATATSIELIKEPTKENFAALFAKMSSHMDDAEYYRKDDLERVLRDMHLARRVTSDFWMYLMFKLHPATKPQADERLQKLSNEPLIQEALARIQEIHLKNTQQAPPSPPR